MTGRWVSPVGHDQTRPVVIFHEWNLMGNNQTLGVLCPVTLNRAFGHYLNVLMTVEI